MNRIMLLVVFFMGMNVFAGMLITSGAAADIGLEGQVYVGGDENVDTASDELDSVSSGDETGNTLFGMYNVLARTLGELRAVAFGGPQMLANAGVPTVITGPLTMIIGVVYGVGVLKFLRGIA